MALAHVRASSSLLSVTCPVRLHCPPDLVIPFIVLPRRNHWQVGGNYPDCPTNKPGHAFTWHTKLSICLQRTPLQKPREQREALAARGTRISVCYDISDSHPLMSLGVIMLTWTWNKTTKLIYSEVDLLHSKTAREFIALWHSLALNHAVKVQSRRQTKPLMRRHLYCTLIASSCYGICILRSQIRNPSH